MGSMGFVSGVVGLSGLAFLFYLLIAAGALSTLFAGIPWQIMFVGIFVLVLWLLIGKK